jgi:hypothetical protein
MALARRNKQPAPGPSRLRRHHSQERTRVRDNIFELLYRACAGRIRASVVGRSRITH